MENIILKRLRQMKKLAAMVADVLPAYIEEAPQYELYAYRADGKYPCKNEQQAQSMIDKIKANLSILGCDAEVSIIDIIKDKVTGLFSVIISVEGETQNNKPDLLERILSFGGKFNIDFSFGKVEETKEQEKPEFDETVSPDERMWNIAKYINKKTDINTNFIYAQICHESANGTSAYVNEHHNFAGLNITDDSPVGKWSFESDKEFADSWIEEIGIPYELNKATTLEEYMDLLVPRTDEDIDENGDYHDQYFMDLKQAYYADMAAILGISMKADYTEQDNKFTAWKERKEAEKEQNK